MKNVPIWISGFLAAFILAFVHAYAYRMELFLGDNPMGVLSAMLGHIPVFVVAATIGLGIAMVFHLARPTGPIVSRYLIAMGVSGVISLAVGHLGLFLAQSG